MKLILSMLMVALLSACAGMDKTSLQNSESEKVFVSSKNPQAQFAWAVYDLAETLAAGDTEKILSLYPVPAYKDQLDSLKMIQEHWVPEAFFQKVWPSIVSARLTTQFKDESISISSINDIDKTVDFRIMGNPVIPLVWRFSLEVNDSNYKILNYQSQTFDLDFNTFARAYASDIYTVISKMSPEQRETFSELSKDEMSREIVGYYGSQNTLSAPAAKIKIELMLTNNERGSISLETVEDTVLRNTYYPDNPTFLGHKLLIAVDNSDYLSILQLLDRLEPRISDKVAVNTSKAFYQLKLNRLSDASKLISKSMRYEADNPWLFVIAREIAIKQKNETLISQLDMLIDDTFSQPLDEYMDFLTAELES